VSEILRGGSHEALAAIDARAVAVALGGRTILNGVDLRVSRGEWVSIVGPNGAGKTTLLRALAGVVGFAGAIDLAGQPSAQLSGRARARVLALVPQSPIVPPAMVVADYVLLGRTAHIPALATEGPTDLTAAREALEHLDLLALADRAMATLSGGERQRVLIARALAQAAPVVLLDEPTTALDVGHQQEVLDLIDELRHQRDLTVVSTMHDLTLAGQYADRLVLLDGGRVVVAGPAAEVLTEANLSRFYRARVRVVDDGGRPVIIPHREVVERQP
jgi:iron complex transport system ATP-binding protein